MARYSVLRLMVFFGFLCALWLLGLRDESERWWLLGLSALGSMVLSFFVLRGPRAEFSAMIARHVDERASRAGLPGPDEIAEDAQDSEGTKDSADTKDSEDTKDAPVAQNAQNARETQDAPEVGDAGRSARA